MTASRSTININVEINRMIRLLFAVAVVMSVAGPVGCAQSGTPKVETIQAPAPDPLAEAKTILTNYANGMPVTSEAESFPDLAARVKEKDAAKGELLEKGLSEIKASPTTARTKAKELLKKL
jgi:hypothetical protein